jgi:large subunit ribosomal protein L16
MLHPRRTKYRKMFGVSNVDKLLHKKEIKGILPMFGVFGLRVDETCILHENQLEAARKTIKKILKKRAKVWIDVYASISITEKPAEVRMGRGKGKHAYWATTVKRGRVIFEVQRLKRKLRLGLIRRALWMGGKKLPVKTSLVTYNV